MTVDEHQALTELYAAHGAVVRELGPSIDALNAVLEVGVELADLPSVLIEVRRRIIRAYDVAGAERERWA